LEISGISGISAAHFRVGRRLGLASVAEDLLGLAVAGDAREQRLGRGGTGNVTTLLHGLGELAMSRAPQTDAAGAHPELSSPVGGGDAARAELAGPIGVLGVVEGWAAGTGHADALKKRLEYT
jgi:hypothetical protein